MQLPTPLVAVVGGAIGIAASAIAYTAVTSPQGGTNVGATTPVADYSTVTPSPEVEETPTATASKSVETHSPKPTQKSSPKQYTSPSKASTVYYEDQESDSPSGSEDHSSYEQDD